MMLGWSDASFPPASSSSTTALIGRIATTAAWRVAMEPSAAVLELPRMASAATASAGAAPGERRATASGQSTSVRFAVMGEGLNPLTSIQVPTESSHAAIGSVASMLMPEVCSL